MSETIYQLFKKIKAVSLDVDGVLTDGSLMCTDTGEWLRTMNIKDGYAIRHSVDKGLHLAVISSSTGTGVATRLQRLGVTNVFQGVEDKAAKLTEWLTQLNVEPGETIYIGDDMPDLPVLKMVGLPCCPADAVQEVLEVCKYVSPFGGGRGCVRDVLEKVMKLQGTWNA